jgi:hypothetical protein
MAKKIGKFVYWTPRILSIVFIIFLALMSLDVFDENYGFWQTIVALLIHNIPSFILLIVVIISWEYEIVGGVAFILAGIAQMIFSVVRADVEPWYISFLASLMIDVPAFIIGILFLIGWKRKRGK